LLARNKALLEREEGLLAPVPASNIAAGARAC
jgi:hypothetical protein